jgi:hypothetical protein
LELAQDRRHVVSTVFVEMLSWRPVSLYVPRDMTQHLAFARGELVEIGIDGIERHLRERRAQERTAVNTIVIGDPADGVEELGPEIVFVT